MLLILFNGTQLLRKSGDSVVSAFFQLLNQSGRHTLVGQHVRSCAKSRSINLREFLGFCLLISPCFFGRMYIKYHSTVLVRVGL